jgi:hypothetical protein
MAEILIRNVQHQRGTAARWASTNPILLDGELGYESDKNRMKVGDGVRRWNDLPYFTGVASDEPVSGELANHIESPTPHPAYDDGPSLLLLYENAKV